MNKVLMYFLVGLVPVLLMANVWQSFRYSRVVEDIARLEEEQIAWREANRRLITGLAVYNSPGRINALAEEELGLEKAGAEALTLIELPENGEDLP